MPVISVQEFSLGRAAYLPVEGVGSNGSFNVAGRVLVSTNTIEIVAKGQTMASRAGRVQWHVEARLLGDGSDAAWHKLTRRRVSAWDNSRGYFPIGSVVFDITGIRPEHELQVHIRASYLFMGGVTASPFPQWATTHLPIAME